MINRGKQNILGVQVDAVDYEAAVTKIITAAQAQQALGVSAPERVLGGQYVLGCTSDHHARIAAEMVVDPPGRQRPCRADPYGPRCSWSYRVSKRDESRI